MIKSKQTTHQEEIKDEETVKTQMVPLKRTSLLIAKFAVLRGKSSFYKGMIQALPIVVGYIPLAFAYGVMAQDVGLTLLATLLMSALVYAGSSQYIAVGMFATSQPMFSIVLTTFIVNLRHLLLCTAIVNHFSKWSLFKRILFATQLTDEVFAVHTTWFSNHKANLKQNFATNIIAHSSWILGSYLGFVAGSALTDIKVYGLDYALSALFIALLIMQIKDRLMVLIALFSGSFALFFTVWEFQTWSIILAAILGATLGMVFELWTKRASS